MEELLKEGVSSQRETPVEPPRKGRFGWLKGRRKWLLLALAAVAAGGLWASRQFDAPRASAAETFQEAAVERRTIIKTLTGSGALQPADSYTVNTLVSGEILDDTFEEGDIVEKGALLYTLDASDASAGLTQSRNSYAQAQSSYTRAVDGKYPTADVDGIVSSVSVRDGDSVAAGMEICKIVSGNEITVDLLFSYADSSCFYVGQSATLYVNGFEGTIAGTVSHVSSSSYASGSVGSSTGRMITTVRVTAENPGMVASGHTATGVIGNYSSYGTSTVYTGTAAIVTAGVSGRISGLSLLPGDAVAQGERICTITGDSVDIQIENARISLENAETSLQNAQDRLDDYRITAPISGTVVTKTAKAGDKIEGGSGGTLCTIYDLSYLEMTLNVDELDIGAVEVGQSVRITADAAPGKSYAGVVTRVSVAGATSGGTTTYPVTVRIDETEGLRPGMNADAEIVLSSAENVTAIPNGALSRGNVVLITAGSPSAANALEREAPEGYVYVQVETGVSDESYMEITFGLQEGDTAAWLRTSGGDGASMMMGGGMMGGPGGNMAVSAAGGPGGRPGGGF